MSPTFKFDDPKLLNLDLSGDITTGDQLYISEIKPARKKLKKKGLNLAIP